MLLNVYETVYKIRSTLLAHKNSPRTSQVQPAAKQVPLPNKFNARMQNSCIKFVLVLTEMVLLNSNAIKCIQHILSSLADCSFPPKSC